MSRSMERAQALLALLDAGDVEGAEAKAEVIWAVDRDSFWWLLDEHVARGRHSLTLGLVLMRAVRSLSSPDPEALGRVFRLTVQRLVPERPQAESEELLGCAQHLRELEVFAERPAWLLLGLASALIHHLHWLASTGDEADLSQGLRQIGELFTELAARSLSTRDRLQFAAALAHYAGLTGDGRWLPEARRSLELVKEHHPRLAIQWIQAVLVKFAIATGEATLWREVIEEGEPLLMEVKPTEPEALDHHERRCAGIYYNSAIAYGFLGDRVRGLSYLAESIALHRERLHMAMSDDDMGPLLSGGGSSSFIFILSPQKEN